MSEAVIRALPDRREPAQPRFASVDELLADARSRLTRLSPREAAAVREDGALLVDIRPQWQRLREGEIPGALVIERNHLEWRLHPTSEGRLPVAAPDRRYVIFCAEGYTSSLAADALNSIGVPATDLVGGFEAWASAGLPTARGGTEPERFTQPDSQVPSWGNAAPAGSIAPLSLRAAQS